VRNRDVRNCTIGHRFHLVGRSSLAPPSGRVALGGRFPGLKPWAEFRSPCGAKNKDLNPGIVADSPFLRSKIILNLTSRHSVLSPNLTALTGVCRISKIPQLQLGSVPNRGIFNPWVRLSMDRGSPRRGYRTQPRVSTLETLILTVRPHKALPRSALLGKHPVRRVGGAEGARDAGTR
jgi:hypothetical protein